MQEGLTDGNSRSSGYEKVMNALESNMGLLDLHTIEDTDLLSEHVMSEPLEPSPFMPAREFEEDVDSTSSTQEGRTGCNSRSSGNEKEMNTLESNIGPLDICTMEDTELLSEHVMSEPFEPSPFMPAMGFEDDVDSNSSIQGLSDGNSRSSGYKKDLNALESNVGLLDLHTMGDTELLSQQVLSEPFEPSPFIPASEFEDDVDSISSTQGLTDSNSRSSGYKKEMNTLESNIGLLDIHTLEDIELLYEHVMYEPFEPSPFMATREFGDDVDSTSSMQEGLTDGNSRSSGYVKDMNALDSNIGLLNLHTMADTELLSEHVMSEPFEPSPFLSARESEDDVDATPSMQQGLIDGNSRSSGSEKEMKATESNVGKFKL